MKKTALLAIAGISLLSFIHPPESCENLLFFKEGASVTMTSYNDDGKVTGSSKTVYKKVTKSSAAVIVAADQEAFDKKGKTQGTSEFTITCAQGNLSFDMKMMAPKNDSYKDMEVSFSGTNLEYPATLNVGTQLKDANMKMTVKTKEGMGMPMMNTEMTITNRKVEAKENVTTPAGTFECYKITEDVSSKTMFTIRAKSATWFSPEIGTVKTESYNEKGKLLGKSEITQITRP